MFASQCLASAGLTKKEKASLGQYLSKEDIATLDNKKKKQTLLVQAVRNKDKSELLKLIRQGSNIDEVDKNGDTALIVATQENNIEMAKLLLKHGANVNLSETNYGITPIFIAVANNFKELIELLLANGADINSKKANGTTPLLNYFLKFIQATTQDDRLESYELDYMRFLVDHGANPYIENNEGISSIKYAESHDLQKFKEILERYPSTNTLNIKSIFDIKSDSFNNIFDVLKYIIVILLIAYISMRIKKSFNIDFGRYIVIFPNGIKKYIKRYGSSFGLSEDQNENIQNALYIAVDTKHLFVIKYLHWRGANLNRGAGKAYDDHTYIGKAAMNGSLNIIKYLTSKGANVNWGMVQAIENDKIEIINYLKAKVDLNLVLEWGCREDRSKAINYAINAGADIMKVFIDAIENDNDKIVNCLKNQINMPTIYHKGIQDNLIKTIEYVMKNGAILINDVFVDACKVKNKNLMEYALANGANGIGVFATAIIEDNLPLVKCLELYINTDEFLIYGISNNAPSVAEYAIEHGANIKEVDAFCKIIKAVNKIEYDAIRLLLESGINMDCVNTEFICRLFKIADPESIKLILEYSVSDLIDKGTLLLAAIETSKYKIVKLLIDLYAYDLAEDSNYISAAIKPLSEKRNRTEKEKILIYLIKQGADLKTNESELLEYSLTNGSILKLLIDKGIDIDTVISKLIHAGKIDLLVDVLERKETWSCIEQLQQLIKLDRLEILNILDKKIDKAHLLYEALKAKSTTIATSLIKNGVDLNKTLCLSIEDNELLSVAFLIEKGGIDPKNDNHLYLKLALEKEAIETVKYLFENYYEPDDLDQDLAIKLFTIHDKSIYDIASEKGISRECLLCFAAESGNKDMYESYFGDEIDLNGLLHISAANNLHNAIKFLLKKGAKVQSENNRALIWACEFGHIDTIKVLLENDADIHSDNDWALCIAADNNDEKTIKYLIEKGAFIDKAIAKAAGNNKLNAIQILKKHDGDIHANHEEALVWASEFGNFEIVEYLLENSVDYRANNANALYAATVNGHKGVIALFES